MLALLCLEYEFDEVDPFLRYCFVNKAAVVVIGVVIVKIYYYDFSYYITS